MQKMYPDGIDRAKKVVSTKHDPNEWVVKYNPDMIERIRNGEDITSGPRKLIQIKTDKEALEQRRMRILVNKEQEKKALQTLQLQHLQEGGTVADGTEVVLENGKVVKTRFSGKKANTQQDLYDNVAEGGLTIAQQGALVFKFSSRSKKKGTEEAPVNQMQKPAESARANGSAKRSQLLPPLQEFSIARNHGSPHFSSVEGMCGTKRRVAFVDAGDD
jgi:hypothetical protein